MSCLLAPYPAIIETAHPTTVGIMTYKDEKIGLFSRVLTQCGLDASPMPDGVSRLSVSDTLIFIYEH
jgi:hypothetical protein